jgi:hypothetical protein
MSCVTDSFPLIKELWGFYCLFCEFERKEKWVAKMLKKEGIHVDGLKESVLSAYEGMPEIIDMLDNFDVDGYVFLRKSPRSQREEIYDYRVSELERYSEKLVNVLWEMDKVSTYGSLPRQN